MEINKKPLLPQEEEEEPRARPLQEWVHIHYRYSHFIFACLLCTSFFSIMNHNMPEDLVLTRYWIGFMFFCGCLLVGVLLIVLPKNGKKESMDVSNQPIHLPMLQIATLVILFSFVWDDPDFSSRANRPSFFCTRMLLFTLLLFLSQCAWHASLTHTTPAILSSLGLSFLYSPLMWWVISDMLQEPPLLFAWLELQYLVLGFIHQASLFVLVYCHLAKKSREDCTRVYMIGQLVQYTSCLVCFGLCLCFFWIFFHTK